MKLIKKYTKVNLVLRIAIGLAIGCAVGSIFFVINESKPDFVYSQVYINFNVSVALIFEILGNLFIGALRAIAPVLVFFLVASSLMSSKSSGSKTVQKTMLLYVCATFIAALVSLCINSIFQVKLVLPNDVDPSQAAGPSQMPDILINLFNVIVANPIDAIANASFLGVLFWSILFGFVARPLASKNIKEGFDNISIVLTNVVRAIIEFAPFGISGLMFTTIVNNGIGIFVDYGTLLLVYVCCIFTLAFVVNPFLVFCTIRRNPFPLVFRCLKDSGITAFFVRSSAANIPINMKICDELHLDKKTASVTIPLGATINMEGTSVTIITLTLSCCVTLGLDVDFGSALLLTFVATISAVGASGVSGGSILLVPMACSLFGISGDISAGVVAVGFIVGVLQDSLETALNSSTDVLFTASVQLREQIVAGKPHHKIVGGTLDDASKMKSAKQIS